MRKMKSYRLLYLKDIELLMNYRINYELYVVPF